MWKKKELSIFGKILFLKTLAISNNFSITKFDSSKRYNFTWGKRDKIKRYILRKDIIHGGVNMIDIETYCLALSTSWVPRIINSQQNNLSFYGKQYLGSFDDISKLNYSDSLDFEKLNHIPSFYKHVIISFCKVNQTEKPVSRDEILNTYIWGNKWITYETASKKQVIYYKSWIESCIIYVKAIKVTQGSIDERYIYNKLRTKNNYLAEIFTFKKTLQTSKIVQRNINVIDVIISEHCEPHIVKVITIICYGIFKYRILSKDTKTKRTVNTFLASLGAYTSYRCMYDLHWQKVYLNKDTVNILKRIIDTAFQ